MNKNEMRIAVDAVVFSVLNEDLKILLIKRKYPPFQNCYALPGGFVESDESLEDAVKRELDEETGIKNVFLKQTGTYGDVNRDPRGRIISVAYLALIKPEQKLISSSDAASAEWFSISSLPRLAFDHELIISDALAKLRLDIQTTNIAFQILSQKFTLTRMQQIYEKVLGMHLDKRNFRKRIKELDILKEANEYMMEGAHRPAMLYMFKDQKFKSIKYKIQIFV